MLLRGIKKDSEVQTSDLTFEKSLSFPTPETFTDDDKYRGKEEKANEK